MKWLQWRCLVWLLALAGSAPGAETFDVILRHGRIVDGSGNPTFSGDLGLRHGRIVRLGRVEGGAPLVIEARGSVIAPGFIDVHTHAEDVEEQPRAENFIRMGVTTLVLGNCGSSTLEVAEFFRRLNATNLAVNVATLVGHGSVRGKAMGGSFMRPPTAAEMSTMKSLVEVAMKEGALGLSTGLIYLPGVFARTDELVELAKVAARHDGIYASHMRSEGREIDEALAEVFKVAREAGVRAEISHIKLAGKPSWGQAARILGLIESARADGLDITQDQYVYTASSTGLSQLIPEEFRAEDQFPKVLADPAGRTRLVAAMKENLKRNEREDYAYAVIASYKPDPALNGLNLVEAARRRRGSATLEDQIELILEIHKNGGAGGIFHGISEEDLQVFLHHPNTMIACDSGVRRFQDGVPHPRGYGNSARVLARYVRELKVLRLEDAIRRMTSLPAAVYRLKDRGMIREGAWADLVVFDPGRVQDQATFSDPHHYATGFGWVLVNGVPVVRDDAPVVGAAAAGPGPGRALPHGEADGAP